MEDAEEAFPLCSAQTGSAGADGVYKNEIKQMRKREAAAERSSWEEDIWIKRQSKKKLISKLVISHYLCKGYLKKRITITVVLWSWMYCANAFIYMQWPIYWSVWPSESSLIFILKQVPRRGRCLVIFPHYLLGCIYTLQGSKWECLMKMLIKLC